MQLARERQIYLPLSNGKLQSSQHSKAKLPQKDQPKNRLQRMTPNGPALMMRPLEICLVFQILSTSSIHFALSYAS